MFQSFDFFDILIILLFPAIFDFSRTIARIFFISLKTRPLHKDHSYFRIHDKKVSILIPAYNEESCIRESIETALTTFYPNKEIIVIDDNSTDKTYSIAKKYADKNLITLIYRKTGGSKAEALNHGYLYANGEIIITTDADSMIEKHAIERMIRKFDDDDVMAVSGNVVVTSGDDSINNLLTELQKYEYKNTFEIGKTFSSLFGTLLLASGAFSAFRRDAINWEGRFCKNTLGEDFDKSIKVNKMPGKKIVHAQEAIAYTHCPTTLGELMRQRNRWASGQITTIRYHSKVVSSSRYRLRFRLALLDMISIDILLNFVSLGALAVLFAGSIIPALIKIDFAAISHTANNVLVLLGIYLILECVVLLYLNRTTNRVPLRNAYLIPLMILWYRPMLMIFTFRGHLRTLLGMKNSW